MKPSQQLEWLWINCKIVAWPGGDEYPIEHNPHANKDCRAMIEVLMEPHLINHFKDAPNWICPCGERGDPCSADWRWSGSGWEHKHDYPVGHVEAERKPLKTIQ